MIIVFLPQETLDIDTKEPLLGWQEEVDAHHAIIPTAKTGNISLSENEKNIYYLIARQYLIQFVPDAVYRNVLIELDYPKWKVYC